MIDTYVLNRVLKERECLGKAPCIRAMIAALGQAGYNDFYGLDFEVTSQLARAAGAALMNLGKMLRSEKEALARVLAERERQDSKWGVQNHDFDRWLDILLEEVGEASKDRLEGIDEFEESVQVAAVLIAWVECRYRHGQA